tara:strand:- start:49 stop:738 length:690 start_codon:yes stop_codon:yes gene_type:complete
VARIPHHNLTSEISQYIGDLMATLGSTGKAEAQNFDNKRKLFLVPNIPIPPEIQEKHQPLLTKYRNQIQDNIDSLEKSLGPVRHVFHELIHESEEKGLAALDAISPLNKPICERICKSSGTFVATDNQQLLFQMMDLQRCLSVGLISQEVYKIISEAFEKTISYRNEYIFKIIDENIKENEVGLLFISEDHKIQFSPDIQVFYISPPTHSELKSLITDFYAVKQGSQTE